MTFVACHFVARESLKPDYCQRSSHGRVRITGCESFQFSDWLHFSYATKDRQPTAGVSTDRQHTRQSKVKRGTTAPAAVSFHSNRQAADLEIALLSIEQVPSISHVWRLCAYRCTHRSPAEMPGIEKSVEM